LTYTGAWRICFLFLAAAPKAPPPYLINEVPKAHMGSDIQRPPFAFLLCSPVRNNKMLAESTLHGGRRRLRRRRTPQKGKEMRHFGMISNKRIPYPFANAQIVPFLTGHASAEDIEHNTVVALPSGRYLCCGAGGCGRYGGIKGSPWWKAGRLGEGALPEPRIFHAEAKSSCPLKAEVVGGTADNY